MSSGFSLTSWGESASLALFGYPSNDGVTVKMPYEVIVLLHWSALHCNFFYWADSNWIWFYCQISWDWLREMNTGGNFDQCWCLSFFGFLRPELSPKGYRNKCFLVALCHLIVRIPNLEGATKRLLHQQVTIQGHFQCHLVHVTMALQLFPVVGIFMRSLGIICYDR